MQFQTFDIQYTNGSAAPGVSVMVYLANTVTPATVYDENGNELMLPLVSGARGQVAFAAASGDYDLRATVNGVEITVENVQFFDGAPQVEERSDLAAHTQDVVAKPYVNVLNYDLTPGVRTKWKYSATEPAHAMKEARTDGGWWEIEPDVVDLRHFGSLADQGEIDAVFASAADYAKQTQRGEMRIPAGRFYVAGLLEFEMLTTIPDGLGSGIDICGAGLGATSLLLPPSNTVGCLDVLLHHNIQKAVVRDMSILSTALIGDETTDTNGNAVSIRGSKGPGDLGWGTPRQLMAVTRNLNIGSDRPSSQGRWDRGLYFEQIWYPWAKSCWINTGFPGNDNDRNYESGAAFHASTCYSPFFHGCKSTGKWDRNFLVETSYDTGGTVWDFEDVEILDYTAVGARVGIEVAHNGTGPEADTLKKGGGRIANGHFNGHQYGIYIKNHRQLGIRGAQALLTNSANEKYADEAAIKLENCRSVIISDIVADENGNYTSDSDKTVGVFFDGDTQDCQVKDSIFAHNGVAFEAASTAGSNVITDNVLTTKGTPSTSGLTKTKIDPSGVLSGSDIDVSITPQLLLGGGSTGMTGSFTGGYVKNGRTVTFWIEITLTAKGSSTGVASIDTGLPAPVSGTDFGFAVSYSEFMTTGVVGGAMDSSGDIILRKFSGSNNIANQLNAGDILGTSAFKISGTYIAA